MFTLLRQANMIRQLEWDRDGKITLEFRGNELAGETGEVCNVIKKLARERLGLRGSRDTREHLAEELADTIIVADLIAMQADIDLPSAIVTKFNKTSEENNLTTRLPPVNMPDEVFEEWYKRWKGQTIPTAGKNAMRQAWDAALAAKP